ncbi:glycoside hydrolase family 27 protein [Reichenbachiella ulvae]|uniref:Alpha-galactosidase n=1 Tax=Reichenbachiella ulvae TaxID=2980104 RepID=A0ABT3D0E0_9BACT|nr:glycoside hydrolase family 27 protein [Reichenbachiella ulvae]MCV9389279.1 glycoside hydrolase family 27 protein [Reichenbachiella ulvae]
MAACSQSVTDSKKEVEESAVQSELVAQTPPMGWNSYNSWGAAVTEKEVRANAEYMAKHMKDKGWEYIVVDYCWSYPHPPGSIQSNPPQFRLKKDNAPVPWLAMDEYGRLLPDSRKFPSSVGGKGFKPLADYIHSLGLKFGIHVMRGIPRQAVWADSPIKGTDVTAGQIADTTSTCPWLNQMYGVDMTKMGAQAYHNSLIDLYSEWGVDFIKVDDIDLKEGYPYRKDEAEAFREAIDQGDRPMVLSLSLNMKYMNRDHVQKQGDMWRISKDFWDEWRLLRDQFDLTAKWSSMSGPNSWPDADMLQLGRISRRGPKEEERDSRFTKDEQITHMSLWSIARSPLMMGGDMPMNSDFVLALLTNEEVIKVNQKGNNPKEVYNDGQLVIWKSEAADGGINLACFNISDEDQKYKIDLVGLGLVGEYSVRDLWKRQDSGTVSSQLVVQLNQHGSALYLLQ